VQYSLLAADTGTDGEQLSLPGAELRYYPAFYSHALCADYQHQLLRDIPWQQDTLSFAGKPVDFTFVPHLTPLIRGIHATLYARLTDPSVDLQSLFEQTYAGESFVDVLPAGSHPETRSVRGANTCRIAVHRPQGGDTVVVLSAIDNLVKGAAGQAVQNMNLMFGLPETLGIDGIALLP
jgi:N-acetyl-gamma-glutamyl-phosphate reductase